jgi:predicted ATP-dependent endonuclease of OLD family
MDVRLARTRERLPYNALSSGLRSFLFRLGYLKTLFFEPPHGSSFVLVDEPEASLHPDFLYDIVDVYQSVCLGSQLFFATHSPIVAAQFKPEERVILEFDENRYVKARRGTAPEGDDPNDVLRSDFHVRSVLGKEGVKKWERFLELDELLRREEDAALREKYRREYMEIGAAYNFEPRVHA